MISSQIVCCLHLIASLTAVVEGTMDEQFEKLANRYVDEFPELSPVAATILGDHRFDDRLDQVSQEGREKSLVFYRDFLKKVVAIDVAKLSRANQVDRAILEHRLRQQLWNIEKLQQWAWNPLVYTKLCGDAIYGLTAREFAPLSQRLGSVADRLEQFPRLFRQIQSTLDPQRVPGIHAKTAISQNRGVLSILENTVHPHLAKLPADERSRLAKAMAIAKEAVEEHQKWLEAELLPNASGDFRLGQELFDQKLAFALQTKLSRQQIRDRAESELRKVRDEMYRIAKEVYKEKHPFTQFPEKPTREYRQAIIRACLEMANNQMPKRDEIVEMAKRSLALTTAFVKEKDLITIPPDPIEIIVMPEFRRGVSLAYCDSPGPLDVGKKTFYAVAPLPKKWDDRQVQSFLREYNVRSIHNLTVHEAMPGHFVQLAHANRYPGKLRAVLASGTFIEGWAVYTEHMMVEQGLLDGDPLMRLVVLKWYLRGIANAILDQAIHTEGVTQEQAMRLMMEDTFQEEREAAGKWIRAQLTSAQLSTYFVGFQEHTDLRREIEKSWGDKFHLKTYHDKVLSFGSPPVKYVRALLLEEAIPR